MAIFSWVLGLIGILIASVFVLRLMRDLFALPAGRGPRTPPDFLLRYGIGIIAGFALCGVSVLLGMRG